MNSSINLHIHNFLNNAPNTHSYRQFDHVDAQQADYLEYLLPLDTQFDEPGSQLALDLLARCSVRHVNFDEDLFHGLVPETPRCLTGDHTAPLFEVHWHAAVLVAGRLTKH